MKYNSLVVSKRVFIKLKYKHRVCLEEIWECFMNRSGSFLEDTRLINKTLPPTFWFVAETDSGRKLKIVFIENDQGCYEIKTAYQPNIQEVKIYEKYS